MEPDSLNGILASAGLMDPAATSFVVCTPVRELTSDDLLDLTRARLDPDRAAIHQSYAAEGNDLQKMKAKHHLLARYLAIGIPEGRAGALAGYSPSTVSTLKSSPAFLELVEHYRGAEEAAFKAVKEELSEVASAASREIMERLHDDERRKGIPTTTLVQVAKLGYDRSGHGPTSHTDVSGNIVHHDAETLRKRRQEAMATEREYVIPARKAITGPAQTAVLDTKGETAEFTEVDDGRG